MPPASPSPSAAAAPWIGLVLAALLAHGAGLGNGFAWDDARIVVQNPATQDLSRLGEVLLSPDEVPPYYRPLTRGSFLLDHAAFGMDPRGFHAVNLLLHVAGVLAVFALARRVLRTAWAAALAALLLAVHPIHVESVAFVTARNNLLALLFSALAVLALVEALRRRSAALAAASGALWLLGLLSKEQAAMAAPIAAAFALVRPAGPDRPPLRRAWPYLLPHAAALLLYAVPRTIALGGPVASAPIGDGLLERLGRFLLVLPRYVELVVWPADLTIFHAVHPPAGALGWAAVALAWGALVATAVLVIRRPTPASQLGAIWFALGLVPVSGVVPIAGAAMAERFLHVAAVGLWLLAADGAERLVGRGVPRRAALAVAGAALVALAGRTVARTLDWRDDVALMRSATRADPGAAEGWYNLGTVLRERGDVAGALAAWEAGLRAEPDHGPTLAQLGTAAAVGGDLARAEALLRRALEADPSLGVARFNLGRIAERTGRPVEALLLYEAFLERPDPRHEALVRVARERVRALRAAGNR